MRSTSGAVSAASAGDRARNPSGSFGPALGLTLAAVLVLALHRLWPGGGGDYAVVFPPWTQTRDILSAVGAAGGTVVRFGAIEAIAVVHSDDPAFVRNIVRDAAWFVVDPIVLGACGSGGTAQGGMT